MSKLSDAHWRFVAGVGSWDCPGCGHRGGLISPDFESLHDSAKKAGLKWVPAETLERLSTLGTHAIYRNSNFAGNYLCATCSHSPDADARVIAARVAKALRP